ncbi:DNA/RNA helicase domain-containing protein [Butyribacter intestini]|uniref:nuclease-related domain-containing DEAD/DEAH box helicase n=1 Tax=Butyribacter intestini TaxID=1703332 RepID=UPI003AB6C96F
MIYSWLSNLEWENCIVLHSLGMAEHVDKIFGEIDFVVIADEGVLCIEVKGGIVKRQGGDWHFINRYGKDSTKKEGSYQQAQGNEQSLRLYLEKRLKNKQDPICRCAYANCVMTPDCVIDADDNIEIIPEITFDKRNTKEDLPKFFERSFKYWKDKTMEKHHFSGRHLQDEDKERLVSILRGDFAFVPAMSLALKRTDEMLASLTDEQYIIMQGFHSKRMLVSGPAGTGKTMMAMDQCRKMTAEGYNELYLCYNKLIANYVRKNFELEKQDIDVSTLHSFLMKKTGETEIEDANFFTDILPNKFIDGIDEYMPDNEKYDVLVIDEGQDLMNTVSVLCLEGMVKGGLSKGRWTIYYDKNQNIFGKYEELQDIYDELEHYGASCYELSVNCRNTKQIATGNWYATNIKQASIMKADGEVVGYHKYDSKTAEKTDVLKLIRRLLSEGISRNDIVILSPYRMDNANSCLCNASIPSDIGEIRLNEFNKLDSDDFIRFYTVKAFKGLEARVILYIDIDDFEDDDERLLNYVAMSRARSLLEVFYRADLEERQKMMLNSYNL